ncbi:hypothetical protein CSA56_00180, partial [candidate division KSB3 bacterium]
MKKYCLMILIGICLAGIPVISYGALDWQIRWNESESIQIARVFIFNPESTNQPFSLEIGDIAETADADSADPQLIIGQDISLRLAPGERKIFDILVYQDIDPYNAYTRSEGERVYQLSPDSYRVLRQYYDTSSTSSRVYPVSIQAISPVPREETGDRRHTYRSGRGYWTSALTDHDHVIEQIIRTGDRMGALHNSIQRAILFYTQGDIAMTDEALKVWEEAFPELRATTPTPTPNSGRCGFFVTAVTSNRTQTSITRTIRIGDVLGAKEKTLSQVIAAEDLTYSVPPNTENSQRLLKAFAMKKYGQPSERSAYVNVINHNSQLEQVIRLAQANSTNPCAIQDVIWYINREVPTLTHGKALWERLYGR